MEFGQIELNYFDWNFQNAKGKLELLRQWNIPVWVMEPVRGGQLAALRPENEARLSRPAGRGRSRLGLPLFAEPARGNRYPVRYEQSATGEGQHCHL